MSYRDRIRKCKFVSPSGNVFQLVMKSAERKSGKKLAVIELAGQSRQVIQDMGGTAITMPVTCTIVGDPNNNDYDIDAARFWDALAEDGPGVFEHPIYGNLSVYVGKKSQSDGIDAQAGAATFDIEFIIAPAAAQSSPADMMAQTADASRSAVRAFTLGQFQESIRRSFPAEFREILEDLGAKVGEILTTATGNIDEIRTAIDTQVLRFIALANSGAYTPEEITAGLIELLLVPTLFGTDVARKIDGFKKSVTAILGLAEVYQFPQERNNYSQLFGDLAIATIAATGVAVVDAEYALPTDIDDTITALIEYNWDVSNSITVYEDRYGVTIDVARYDTAQRAVFSALHYLTELAKTYPRRQTTVIDRYITPIQFLCDKQGHFDGLADFIHSNNLTLDEIMLLEPGREVSWYA